MKKLSGILLHILVLCVHSGNCQVVSPKDDLKEARTVIAMCPMDIMISPQTLMKVWLDDPIPIAYYTSEEKQVQKFINEKIADKIIVYSPISVSGEWTSVDFEEITPYNWKWVDFDLSKPDSTISKISLLRPNWWLKEIGADAVGKQIFLNMPELGSQGWATVKAIRVNQLDTRFWDENRKGDYASRPITGRFEHTSNDVYNLYFENNPNPLGVTGSHPIWSMDRNDWVGAKELLIGEKVKTQEGVTVLKSRTKSDVKQKVYNLEIYKDHNFLVGMDKIIVHNNCWDDILKNLDENVIYSRIVKKDKKGRTYGVNSPNTPSLADFNPRIEMFYAEDLGELIPRHGINEAQLNALRELSNEELIKFRADDPISINGSNITGGHHRIYEILRRVKEGTMPANTPISILHHD